MVILPQDNVLTRKVDPHQWIPRHFRETSPQRLDAPTSLGFTHERGFLAMLGPRWSDPQNLPSQHRGWGWDINLQQCGRRLSSEIALT